LHSQEEEEEAEGEDEEEEEEIDEAVLEELLEMSEENIASAGGDIAGLSELQTFQLGLLQAHGGWEDALGPDGDNFGDDEDDDEEDSGDEFEDSDEDASYVAPVARFRLRAALPGWDALSFGYHSDDGNIFTTNSPDGALPNLQWQAQDEEDVRQRRAAREVHNQEIGLVWGVGDVVGCGLVYPPLAERGAIFFTRNGKIVHLQAMPPTFAPHISLPLFPVVGISCYCPVTLNFGHLADKPFVFDVRAFEQNWFSTHELSSSVMLPRSDGPASDHSDPHNYSESYRGQWLGRGDVGGVFDTEGSEDHDVWRARKDAFVKNAQNVWEALQGEFAGSKDVTMWPYLLENRYDCPQAGAMLSPTCFYPKATKLPMLRDSWHDKELAGVPRRGSYFDVRAFVRNELQLLTRGTFFPRGSVELSLSSATICEFGYYLLQDSKLKLHANKCTEFSLFHTHGLHVELDRLVKGMNLQGRNKMRATDGHASESRVLVDDDVLNGYDYAPAGVGPQSLAGTGDTGLVRRDSPAQQYLQHAAENLRVAGERILGGAGADEEMEAVVSVAVSALAGQSEIFDKTAALVTETSKRIFGGAGKKEEMEEELGLSTPPDSGVE